jgi:hypothetical protein
VSSSSALLIDYLLSRMVTPIRRRALLALGFVWLVVAAADALAAGPTSYLPGVTLVEGKQALFLQRQPVANLRVYAFHGEVPTPIPFQVDERDQRDRWVLDQGTSQNPENPSGELDSNDAVVIMNRDLGGRGDPAKLPAAAAAWGEVRVGSETNPLGFAYVGVFAHPSPLPSPVQGYARYEPESDRVYGERYALEFRAPLPTHVAFVDQLGEFGTNVVAGVHAVGDVRFLGGLVQLHRTDADIQTELLGYRSGPVRVIRRGRYWVPLPLGFRTSGRVDLLFYRDFIEGTTLLKVKIAPRLVVADGKLQAYFDFLDLRGARVLVDKEQSEPVNGHMTPTKQALADRSTKWAALLLPNGRTVLLAIRLEGALEQLDPHLYFDDLSREDGQLGGQPLFGLQFPRLNRLKSGEHRLSVFAAVLESTAADEIRQAAQIFLSPPEVSVSLVKQGSE